MLFIFGGLPGTGKSILSQMLARERGAVYLRIDTVEQAIRNSGAAFHGPEGYAVAYQLAADNLRLGLDVVADSVNPVQITREAWRRVGRHCGVPFTEIEVVCSDKHEHRRRVEERANEIPGLRLPTWADVLNRNLESWDHPHIVIDTAGRTVEQSFGELLHLLRVTS